MLHSVTIWRNVNIASFFAPDKRTHQILLYNTYLRLSSLLEPNQHKQRGSSRFGLPAGGGEDGPLDQILELPDVLEAQHHQLVELHQDQEHQGRHEETLSDQEAAVPVKEDFGPGDLVKVPPGLEALLPRLLRQEDQTGRTLAVCVGLALGGEDNLR